MEARHLIHARHNLNRLIIHVYMIPRTNQSDLIATRSIINVE